MSLEERFLVKFRITLAGCWEWTAYRQPTGYGVMWNGFRSEQAHRISYRMYCGEIPADREIDHKCHNRACVNPEHLQLITHRENIRLSETVMGINARKDVCMRGHPLEGTNLRITVNGYRACRACVRMHVKAYKKRKRVGG
jgi:hypothetical protein